MCVCVCVSVWQCGEQGAKSFCILLCVDILQVFCKLFLGVDGLEALLEELLPLLGAVAQGNAGNSEFALDGGEC